MGRGLIQASTRSPYFFCGSTPMPNASINFRGRVKFFSREGTSGTHVDTRGLLTPASTIAAEPFRPLPDKYALATNKNE